MNGDEETPIKTDGAAEAKAPTFKLTGVGSLDEYGAAVYAQIAPALRNLGNLRDTELATFLRYCDIAGQYWRMTTQIRDEGEWYWAPSIAKDAEGKPGKLKKRNPLVQERNRLLPELRALEDRFGLSPLARANLVNREAGGMRGGDGSLFDAPDDDAPEMHGDDPSNFN